MSTTGQMVFAGMTFNCYGEIRGGHPFQDVLDQPAVIVSLTGQGTLKHRFTGGSSCCAYRSARAAIVYGEFDSDAPAGVRDPGTVHLVMYAELESCVATSDAVWERISALSRSVVGSNVGSTDQPPFHHIYYEFEWRAHHSKIEISIKQSANLLLMPRAEFWDYSASESFFFLGGWASAPGMIGRAIGSAPSFSPRVEGPWVVVVDLNPTRTNWADLVSGRSNPRSMPGYSLDDVAPRFTLYNLAHSRDGSRPSDLAFEPFDVLDPSGVGHPVGVGSNALGSNAVGSMAHRFC